MTALRTSGALLLLMALIAPAAANPPRMSGALKKRLQALQTLEVARTDALSLIRDSTHYIKGNTQAQREVTQATAKVEKAFAQVERLAQGDLKRLLKKKKDLQALQSARSDRLSAWERLLLKRLGDMQVLVRNEKIPGELDKSERPSAHQLQQVRLTNDYRILMGLNALGLELRLTTAATGHSEEMRRMRYFDHTSPINENRTPFVRATKAGFQGSSVGENIAQGYRSPRAVHQGWLTSPGHHRNIVEADWEVMGVANCSDYWTQVFGRVTPIG